MQQRYYVVVGGSYGAVAATTAQAAVWRLLWRWQQCDRIFSPVGRVSRRGYELPGSQEFVLQPFLRLVDAEAGVYEVRHPGEPLGDGPRVVEPPPSRPENSNLRGRHTQFFDPAYQHLEPLCIRARYQPKSPRARVPPPNPHVDPSPADIRAAAAQIRQQWDEHELDRRLHPSPFGRGQSV